MDADELRRAPAGKFRVIGYDQYDYSDYLIGDYGTRAEAIQTARDRAKVPNGIPTSFSDLYLIYDDQGICLGKITFDDLSQL